MDLSPCLLTDESEWRTNGRTRTSAMTEETGEERYLGFERRIHSEQKTSIITNTYALSASECASEQTTRRSISCLQPSLIASATSKLAISTFALCR
jgi:hypothetical protein